MAYLKFYSDRMQDTYQIKKTPCNIGRSRSSDIVLHGNKVSRSHARILKEDDTYILEDMQSRNGTYVNDKIVTQPTKLKHGDSIDFGLELKACFFQQSDIGDDERPTTPINRFERLNDNQIMVLLLEISKTLNSTLSYTEVMQRVIDAVIELTRVERGFVILLDKAQNPDIVIARNQDKQPLSDNELRVSHSAVAEILKSDEPIIIYDAKEDSILSQQESISALHLRTILGVPLQIIDKSEKKDRLRTIGCIYADSTKTSPREAHNTLDILGALAGHAAIAIENARMHEELLEKERMEEDLKIARGIQRSLFPQDYPQGYGVTIRAINIPYRAVGGDYYDFIKLEENQLAVTLGDITGKGLPASLMMASLRATLRALCTQNLGPVDLITRLNRLICQQSAVNKYVTFFYGLVLEQGSFSYTNAGHNPPFYIPSEGNPRQLKTGGMILGVLDDTLYEQETLKMVPGDTLLLYTDGLIEARNSEGVLYGEEHLSHFCQKHKHIAPDEFLEALLDDVKVFCNGLNLRDDLTVIVLRVDS